MDKVIEYEKGYQAGLILGRHKLIKKISPILTSLIADFESRRGEMKINSDRDEIHRLTGMIGLADEILKIIKEQGDE